MFFINNIQIPVVSAYNIFPYSEGNTLSISISGYYEQLKEANDNFDTYLSGFNTGTRFFFSGSGYWNGSGYTVAPNSIYWFDTVSTINTGLYTGGFDLRFLTGNSFRSGYFDTPKTVSGYIIEPNINYQFDTIDIYQTGNIYDFYTGLNSGVSRSGYVETFGYKTGFFVDYNRTGYYISTYGYDDFSNYSTGYVWEKYLPSSKLFSVKIEFLGYSGTNYYSTSDETLISTRTGYVLRTGADKHIDALFDDFESYNTGDAAGNFLNKNVVYFENGIFTGYVTGYTEVVRTRSVASSGNNLTKLLTGFNNVILTTGASFQLDSNLGYNVAVLGTSGSFVFPFTTLSIPWSGRWMEIGVQASFMSADGATDQKSELFSKLTGASFLTSGDHFFAGFIYTNDTSFTGRNLPRQSGVYSMGIGSYHDNMGNPTFWENAFSGSRGGLYETGAFGITRSGAQFSKNQLFGGLTSTGGQIDTATAPLFYTDTNFHTTRTIDYDRAINSYFHLFFYETGTINQNFDMTYGQSFPNSLDPYQPYTIDALLNNSADRTTAELTGYWTANFANKSPGTPLQMPNAFIIHNPLKSNNLIISNFYIEYI